MKDIAIIVSPNFKDYAKKYLAPCLEAIRSQDCIDRCQLFLIDNATTEESAGYLKSMAPEAEILYNSENAGFAKGNNIAMKLALEQGYKYLVLLNMDTEADHSSISELVKVADAENMVGAIQSRLMLWPEKHRVNSIGNMTHFLGFGFSNGYQSVYQDDTMAPSPDIFYPSGAAVLFKADVLRTVGLFDEEFWMYAEDQDIGWRIWLAGFRCVLAPASVVYHKYEFGRSIEKYYWMDRNRVLVVLKNYKLLTILLIMPAFVIMEFGLIYFSLKNGSWQQKKAVYRYFLKASTWKYLSTARKKTQSIRKVSDRSLIGLFSSSIEYQEIMSPALMIANKVFAIYWRMVRRLIVW